jgi:hypothetical protein
MADNFKVKDSKLLDNIFMLADVTNNGALDIREICSTMIFNMRGSMDHKLSLFF